MTIKEELNSLKETDVFSLMLFVLYKMQDIKEYSTLSELVYVLDKQNLLNLCEYFGGITLTIPTIQELESLINTLVLYQYVDLEGMAYEDAVEKIGFEPSVRRKIKSDYTKISKILNNYSFGR